jgi:lipopolysaccharide transport system ATP-binding protein
METVVRAADLGKKYLLSHAHREPYQSFRDSLTRWAKSAARPFLPSIRAARGPGREEFWALKDVSFEIQRGDRIGIIGRNGAGKSTLLKILSRITEPTQGRVTIKGRVASLLEVGTGFHPELTGRENIYLNGSILGMRRAEIRRKFDDIVAFAEVTKFLDTPVKRYSSGMYVRLAFAIAAHLEPEILVVDEVLAVGDAQFQKKCLGKMEEVAKGGRTILFVSHNMAAVENLCHRGIVLAQGRMVFDGPANDAIGHYMRALAEAGTWDLRSREDRKGEGKVRIVRLGISGDRGGECSALPVGADVRLEVGYDGGAADVANPRIVIGVYDSLGVGITRFDTDVAPGLARLLPNAGSIACHVRGMSLTPGRYFLNIALFSNGAMQDHVVAAATFEIVESDYFETGKTFDGNESRLTKAYFRHRWEVLT